MLESVIVNYHADYKTGEVFDFSRVEERLENLPDGKLREKLLGDIRRSQRTLHRIMRNTAKRLAEIEEFRGYELWVGPDGWRALDSLSFAFSFYAIPRQGEKKRDMNGGIIFHGSHKLFDDNLNVLPDVDWNDETIASIGMHT